MWWLYGFTKEHAHPENKMRAVSLELYTYIYGVGARLHLKEISVVAAVKNWWHFCTALSLMSVFYIHLMSKWPFGAQHLVIM